MTLHILKKYNLLQQTIESLKRTTMKEYLKKS